jgi:uncharacterized membrane protein (DUF2068 family)
VPHLDRGVLLIAILKLVKATVLAGVGLTGLLLAQAQLVTLLARTAMILHPGGGFIHRLLMKLDGMSPLKEKGLALLVLLYAAVFTVEGGGLLRAKPWAEWLTVGVTASFIPFEIYELVERPGAGRAITLALNVAVVAYLTYRRFHH